MMRGGRKSVQRPINERSQEGFIPGFANVTDSARVYIVCKTQRRIKHREKILRWIKNSDELSTKKQLRPLIIINLASLSPLPKSWRSPDGYQNKLM